MGSREVSRKRVSVVLAAALVAAGIAIWWLARSRASSQGDVAAQTKRADDAEQMLFRVCSDVDGIRAQAVSFKSEPSRAEFGKLMEIAIGPSAKLCEAVLPVAPSASRDR
jgi:hypothetical protein